MTGEHVIYDETADLSLAAENPAPADPQLEADFATLALIRRLRDNHTTWTRIGIELGMTGPQAKRHHRRLHASTRRAWYLRHNQAN